MNSTIDFTLDYLIYPYKRQDFFDQFWTKNYLHIKRNSIEYYKELLTLNDIDSIITTQCHNPIRIVKNRNVIPEELYAKGQDVESIIEYFNKGASIVFDRLDITWEPLRKLAWNVSKDLIVTKDIFSNVYLAPVSSQAFNVHMDWQDVFILQIYGEKVWRLYDSEMKLPINDEQCSLFAKNIDESNLIKELVLKPGEMLYVPRGMPHEVITKNKQSLHITFTVVPFTNYEILVKLIEKISNYNVKLREQLPESVIENPLPHLTGLMESILEHKEFSTYIDDIFWNTDNHKNISNFKDYFTNQSKLSGKAIDQLKFKLRKGINVKFDKVDNDSYKITTKHNEFEINLANSELEYIFQDEPFQINELPGSLSVENKIELLVSLMNAGIITID